MLNTIVQTWLDAQCTSTFAAVGGLVMLVAPGGLKLVPAAVWPRGELRAEGLAEAARSAFNGQKPVIVKMAEEDGTTAAQQGPVVSYPLSVGGRPVGAFAVALDSPGADETGAQLQEVARAAAQFESLVANINRRESNQAVQVLRFLATVLSQGNFRDAATALATELATGLSCDRVSIGFRDSDYVKVEALSHNAEFAQRQGLLRAIGSAMDEAADQATTVLLPQPEDAAPLVTLAHIELAREYGSQHLCSVPLVSAGKVLGTLTCERVQGQPFTADTVALCEHVACLVGPTLALLRAHEGTALDKAKSRVSEAVVRLFGPGNLWLKLTATGIVAALLGLGLIQADYRVAAPAKVEGAIQRVLVAPTDGFLKQAHVRPGDHVKAGQPLAELAGEDLTLERRKLESEVAQYENAYAEALAKFDRAQIVIQQARAAEARAQLALIEQQLARAQIVAPFDGIVIKGDLSQSLGAPVKRGDILLTLAPNDDYRIIAEVDERDIDAVKIGQSGRLALAAAPNNALTIRVTRITPVSTAQDGRNFFEVETGVEGGLVQLRPGLQGVAKIDAGERPLLWILAHRAVDWLRLTLWSWVG